MFPITKISSQPALKSTLSTSVMSKSINSILKVMLLRVTFTWCKEDHDDDDNDKLVVVGAVVCNKKQYIVYETQKRVKGGVMII